MVTSDIHGMHVCWGQFDFNRYMTDTYLIIFIRQMKGWVNHHIKQLCIHPFKVSANFDQLNALSPLAVPGETCIETDVCGCSGCI